MLIPYQFHAGSDVFKMNQFVDNAFLCFFPTKETFLKFFVVGPNVRCLLCFSIQTDWNMLENSTISRVSQFTFIS